MAEGGGRGQGGDHEAGHKGPELEKLQTDEIKDSLADMLLAFQNEAKAIYNSKLMLKDKLPHIGEASAKIVTHETNLDDKQGSFEVIPQNAARREP